MESLKNNFLIISVFLLSLFWQVQDTSPYQHFADKSLKIEVPLINKTNQIPNTPPQVQIKKIEHEKWFEQLLKMTVSALKRQEAENEKRSKEGKSHLNDYVVNINASSINLNPESLQPFIREIGGEAVNMLSDNEITNLREKIRTFHDKYNPTDSKNKALYPPHTVHFYVLLINNLNYTALRSVDGAKTEEELRNKGGEANAGALREILAKVSTLVQGAFDTLQVGYPTTTQKFIFNLSKINALEQNADNKDAYFYSCFKHKGDALGNSVHKKMPGIRGFTGKYTFLDGAIDVLNREYGALKSMENDAEIKYLPTREKIFASHLKQVNHNEGSIEGYEEFKIGGFRYNFNALYRKDVGSDRIDDLPCGMFVLHHPDQNVDPCTQNLSSYSPANGVTSATLDVLVKNYMERSKYTGESEKVLKNQFAGQIKQALQVEEQCYKLNQSVYTTCRNQVKFAREKFARVIYNLGINISPNQGMFLVSDIVEYVQNSGRVIAVDGKWEIDKQAILSEMDKTLGLGVEARVLEVVKALFGFQYAFDQACKVAKIDEDLEEFLARKPGDTGLKLPIPEDYYITVLLMPNAVDVPFSYGTIAAGHAAFLLGNDRVGWCLYSKERTENSALKRNGDRCFRDLETFNSAENSLYPRSPYTRYCRMKILTPKTEEQFDVLKNKAKLIVDTPYDLWNANCIDACSSMLTEIGLDPGWVPLGSGVKYWFPNCRYESIVSNNTTKFPQCGVVDRTFVNRGTPVSFCPTNNNQQHTTASCEDFRTISQLSGLTFAQKQALLYLCLSLPSGDAAAITQKVAIAQKLEPGKTSTSLTLTQLQAFLNDVLEQNNNPNALGHSNNLAQLTVGHINAWVAEHNAVNTATRRLNRDWQTLLTIRTIQTTDANLFTDLCDAVGISGDFSTRLNRFLQTYSVADCAICENQFYGMPSLAGVWENAKYGLSLSEAGIVGAINLLNTSTFWHNSGEWAFPAKLGANHTWTDLRSRGWGINEIDKIDQRLANSNREYDVRRKNNEGYAEHKSYALSNVTAIGSGSWKDFDQFLSYLQQPEVKDMNGLTLEYVFNAKQTPNTNQEIEKAFQKMMCANCEAGNTTTPKTLTSQGEAVFERIWNNSGANGAIGLRESLFPNLDYANKTLDELKPQALIIFQSTVSNTSNSFYGFIKIR